MANGEQDDARLELTEIGLGITVLGVVINMGLALALGLHVSLLWRLVAGFGGPLLFVIVVAIGSRRVRLTRTVTHAVTRHGPDPWSTSGDDSD